MGGLAKRAAIHDRALSAVVQYARQLGLEVSYVGWDTSGLLRFAMDHTARFVRYLPDVVITDGRRAILVDAKTHQSPIANDLTLNYGAVVRAIALSRLLGVNILYAYTNGVEVGLWAHQIGWEVPIREVRVPSRSAHEVMSVRRAMRSGLIPRVPIIQHPWRSGSGLAFVVIDEAVIRQLPSWRHEISRYFGGDTNGEQVVHLARRG